VIAPIVVVGGGHGGFHLALALREAGVQTPVILVDARDGLPVQRPPLSKAILANGDATTRGRAQASLPFRPADFYARHDIRLRHATVVEIDRPCHEVRLADGDRIAYSHLVLATGARNRRPDIPGVDLPGVVELRTPEDALHLTGALDDEVDVVVVGGGFIGLEVASAAAARGRRVTVLEALDRVMSRVVSAPISEHFQVLHAARGVEIRTGAFAAAIHGDHRVAEVELADGTRVPAGLVVLGIGILPEDRLARDAGLSVSNGIDVDSTLLTSDPSISAIGDCAQFPLAGVRRRLESVQNAADHARTVALRLAGSPEPYCAVPWFWSEQFSSKLQIAGVASGEEDAVVRLDGPRGFSVLHLAGGRLTVVESVDRPADHVAARRLLASGAMVDADRARSAGFRLTDLLADAE